MAEYSTDDRKPQPPRPGSVLGSRWPLRFASSKSLVAVAAEHAPQPRRRTCRAPNHPRRRVTLSCIRGPCSLYTQGLVQYNETIRVRRLRCKSQTLHSSWSRCEYTRRNALECTSHLCTYCNSWSAALQRLFLRRHAHVGARGGEQCAMCARWGSVKFVAPRA